MIRIYDTKTKKKEEFRPIEDKKVGMYVCGPTVYDVAHLGHGRSAVAFDVIRKYFEYCGFDVKFVSNYTDIDDKMINRAKEEGISVSELADKIIPEYEADYGALGVAKPDLQPRATEHIEEVVGIIGKLEEGEYAYVIDGDGVYFDVSKFEKYGELSGQNLEDLKMGARVDVNKAKKNPYDFALWKFKKEGEPAWDSPWGEGRPGWHIECSAMSFKHLGREFDIHGGGLDLQFPHHECEVAQSVCALRKDALDEKVFAKYWIHNGFINVNNEKMSKSLGNFSTLKEIFEKYDPQVVRFMFLQTHYRNPIDFSDELLEQAKAALGRLHGFVRGLRVGYEKLKKDVADLGKGSKRLIGNADEFGKKFEECMNNDFDVAGALGVVFELVKAVNGLRSVSRLTKEDVDEAEKFLKEADKVFGVIFPTKEQTI
ncbi:MAG: cysteine--tRNA ligase, partial [Nitrospirae bacterium]|nr:cysteine--tRNA ligase [Nitrospirota bacterium]